MESPFLWAREFIQCFRASREVWGMNSKYLPICNVSIVFYRNSMDKTRYWLICTNWETGSPGTEGSTNQNIAIWQREGWVLNSVVAYSSVADTTTMYHWVVNMTHVTLVFPWYLANGFFTRARNTDSDNDSNIYHDRMTFSGQVHSLPMLRGNCIVGFSMIKIGCNDQGQGCLETSTSGF